MLNYPEKEIILIDLCKKLLQKWKMIALILIIGVLVGAGITIYTGKAIITITNDAGGSGIEAIRDSLSEERRSIVEKNVVLHKDLLEKRKKYQDKIDDFNEKKQDGQVVSLYYLITYDEKSRGLVDALRTIIYDDELLESLKPIVKNEDLAADEMREIVMITLSDKADKLINELSSGMMQVDIYADDMEACKSIKEIVGKRLLKKSGVIQAQYPKFSIEKFSENTIKQSIETGQEKYFEYLANIKSINDSLYSLKVSMDEKETEYFKAMINNNADSMDSLENAKPVTVFSKKVLVEYMILFGVGFVFLYMVWFCFYYIITDRLHTAQTLKQHLGLNILCKIKEDDCVIAYEEIQYDLKNTPGTKIGILTSSNDSSLQKMIDVLKKKDKDNVIVPLNAHPCMEEDFAALLQIEKAILIEKEEKSSVKDIVDVVNYYRNKGIVIENVIMAE